LLQQCNVEMRDAKQSVEILNDNIIVIPLSTVYSNWNQGHELSVMVYTHLAYRKTIEKYPNKKVYIAVSSQAVPASRNTTQLINYLFPTDRVLFVKTNTVYYFNQFVSPPTNYFNLNFVRRHNHVGDVPEVTKTLDYLVDCVKNNPLHEVRLKPILDKCGGKFVLAKTEYHKAARKSGIVPNFVLDNLKKHGGWYVINPEELSLMEVIYLLSHATEVIMGSGSIQYTHRYFINREAQIYTLFTGSHNYPPYEGQKEKSLGFTEDKTSKEKWKSFLRRSNEGNL